MMIKLFGIIIMLITSVMAGSFAAEGLKNRVMLLRQIRSCLEAIRLMIRYEALEVTEITRRLAEDEKLNELKFLKYLNGHIYDLIDTEGMSFSQAWRKALSDNGSELDDRDAELLYQAGDILGSCDCEGQLSVLSRLCAECDGLIAEAKEDYAAKGKLYRALGAVGGALIAVIAI